MLKLRKTRQIVLLCDLENCSGNLQGSSALIARLHFQACSCHVSACWVATEPHAPIKYLNRWSPPRGFELPHLAKTIPDYTSRLLLGVRRHLIMDSIENETQSRSEGEMTSDWEGQRLAEPRDEEGQAVKEGSRLRGGVGAGERSPSSRQGREWVSSLRMWTKRGGNVKH